LKRHIPPAQAPAERSPPMRGRGLKQADDAAADGEVVVAPHAGAWIETCAE